MSELLIMVEREFLERVRTKSFIIGTLVFPIYMAVVLLLPTFVEQPEGERTVVVLDRSPEGVGALFAAALTAGSDTGDGDPTGPLGLHYDARRVPSGTPVDSLNALVLAEEVDAYVILGPDILATGEVSLRARTVTNQTMLRDIRAAATAAVQTVRLDRVGLEPQRVRRLMEPVTVHTARITDRGEEGGGARATFIMAYVLAFLMYFVIAMYGHAVMRSVIQEKVTRVSEILVSTVRPVRLMAGKVTGVSAAALLQIGIWALLVLLVASQGELLQRHFDVSPATLAMFSLDPSITLVLFLLFVIGFLLYAALFAALGAAMSSEQEAQPFQMMLLVPLFVPLLFMAAIINEPEGGISTFLSYFPMTAPVALPMRLAAAPAAWGHVAVALVGMLLTGIAISWVAGKIYRAGILATGKRASLTEIVRWIRAA